MPDTGAPWNIPYVAASDLVADWPTDNQTLAEAIADGLTAAQVVKQVVTTTKTDTFSTTSTSYVDITGLSVTITPADNTNKILLVASFGQIDTNGTTRFIRIQFLRDSTPIGVGDAASTRTQASIVQRIEASNSSQSAAWTYVDSPATTSAITYKAQMLINASTAYINRTGTDSDDPLYSRGVCSLTAFEIEAS